MSPVPPASCDVQPTPTEDEAAAIAAAIEAQLQAEAVAAAAQDKSEQPSWEGDRWLFAGRVRQVRGQRCRVPKSAPTSGWKAAGRADRFTR